ncbi:MAG: hypothetical protein JW794_08460 [Candidatus Cloacimonetes bacterium]|nr:hypothetical protein [Candidatus Cloacimonadota bacterium]
MSKYNNVLRTFRNKYVLNLFLENILYLIAILALFFILFSFLCFKLTTSYEFYEPLTFWSLASKIITGLLFIVFIIRFLLNIPSMHTIARKVSETNPEKNEIILSAYELDKRFDLSDYSKEILDKARKDADERSSELSYKDIFQLFGLRRAFQSFLFGVVALIIVLLINPIVLKTSSNIIFHPSSFAPKYDSFIIVKPGNARILKGNSLQIDVINFYPELSYILNIEKQKRWQDFQLDTATHTIYNVTENIRYTIANEYANSDTFTIEVLEKPIVKNLGIRYDYPAYTKLTDRVDQDISGKIVAIKGTEIVLDLIVNNELTDYRIVFSDGTTHELTKIGKFAYRTAFTVDKSSSYHFYFKDILGNTNNIVERTIFAEEDLQPKIEIMFPARDKILAQNMQERIDFTASDDFGVDRIDILYKKNDGEYISRTVFDTTGITTLTASYNFDVTDQNLLPGDVIFYYLQVYDNCTVPEAQTAKTKIYLLKFPSIEELYDEIQKQQSGNMDDMRESLEESRKNKQKFDELRRKFLKNEEMDWQQKEDLKEVIKKQQELAKKAEEAAKEYEKFVDELEKNNAVARETLEKLKQIQELMKDISSPELETAMKELQKQMEKISPEQMKNALNNFKFSQEDFNKKLEQTLKLLKSIQLEQKLQEALQKAKELEKLQEDLNKQTSERIDKKQDLSELAQSQSDIQEGYQSLKKELEELTKELAAHNEKNAANELEKGLQQATQNQLSDSMQKAVEMLKRDNPQCKREQTNIQVGFSELRNSICMAQMKMQASLFTEFQKLLKKTLNELLYYSQKQEIFLDKSYSTYDILDQEISMYEGIKNSVNTLFRDPMMILMMDPKFFPHSAMALNNFEKMFDRISENSHANIEQDKVDILHSINLMIIDLLLSKSKQPQGSGGSMQQLLQQLQQMSQGQQSINMLTQALLEQFMSQQSQGMGLSDEQKQMLDRIAGNEQQIKENFERMLRDYPEAEKLLGNMEGLKGDLKEVVDKLQQGIIDDQVIRKQENILSRLLDAQRSIHERDYSKKRESETPNQETWEVPDDLIIDTTNMEVRDILKYINENYPEEYHRLIKEYLEKIQHENNK